MPTSSSLACMDTACLGFLCACFCASVRGKLREQRAERERRMMVPSEGSWTGRLRAYFSIMCLVSQLRVLWFISGSHTRMGTGALQTLVFVYARLTDGRRGRRQLSVWSAAAVSFCRAAECCSSQHGGQ